MLPISQDKGWFEEEGLNLASYESYVTGMALASALARGDIQVAYLCLVPAINVYANAKVSIMVMVWWLILRKLKVLRI